MVCIGHRKEQNKEKLLFLYVLIGEMRTNRSVCCTEVEWLRKN